MPAAAEPAGHQLPGVLGEIAEVAGEEAAVKIALRWGGRELHFPQSQTLDRVGDSHVLVGEVGRAAARRLARRFNGAEAYIPKAPQHMAAVLLARGLHPSAVAERLRLSRRTVQRAAASLRGPAKRVSGKGRK